MKTLYLIGGTMGAGKTTVSQELKSQLSGSVFLDGDWCWDANPFQVTAETKEMVIDNITYLLNSFLRCSAYEHVIFCWVMHEQSIINDILARLNTQNCRVLTVSLIINGEVLKKRLQKDVDAGLRAPDIILRSVQRLPLYEKLDTIKIDVSDISPRQAAQRIMQLQCT